MIYSTRKLSIFFVLQLTNGKPVCILNAFEMRKNRFRLCCAERYFTVKVNRIIQLLNIGIQYLLTNLCLTLYNNLKSRSMCLWVFIGLIRATLTYYQSHISRCSKLGLWSLWNPLENRIPIVWKSLFRSFTIFAKKLCLRFIYEYIKWIHVRCDIKLKIYKCRNIYYNYIYDYTRYGNEMLIYFERCLIL